jgi:ectoine hydroxylase-related dioxygenase (phytanoyl-CoA dioxygenase family)
VGPRGSCIHHVPLSDDPHYPDALERTDFKPETARAAPVSAGDALAWNANALHWGGTCDAAAAGPRVSLTFSLARADAAERMGSAPLDPLGLDAEARLDAVAHAIAVYGEGQPDVPEEARKWARARGLLRELTARLRPA